MGVAGKVMQQMKSLMNLFITNQESKHKNPNRQTQEGIDVYPEPDRIYFIFLLLIPMNSTFWETTLNFEMSYKYLTRCIFCHNKGIENTMTRRLYYSSCKFATG